MEIEIEIVGKGKATGKLDDRNPETAKKLYEIFPLPGTAHTYLEEVYFNMTLELDYENPSKTTEEGDICYWPPGPAFCIFYRNSQPVSEVNNIGKITKNLELFKKCRDGDEIIVKKVKKIP